MLFKIKIDYFWRLGAFKVKVKLFYGFRHFYTHGDILKDQDDSFEDISDLLRFSHSFIKDQPLTFTQDRDHTF